MELVGAPPMDGVVIPRGLRKSTTATDMRMLATFGHRERTAEDVKDLFTAADERFDVVRLDTDTKPGVVLLEAIWRG